VVAEAGTAGRSTAMAQLPSIERMPRLSSQKLAAEVLHHSGKSGAEGLLLLNQSVREQRRWRESPQPLPLLRRSGKKTPGSE
jgi:hypothetical protein